MSRICEICGKKKSSGNSVSHSNKKTKRIWQPNLQKVRALVSGAPRRILVCASCIRNGKISKP